jgi:hypothetical protein
VSDQIIQSLSIPCSHEYRHGRCERVAGNIAFWASGRVTVQWKVKHDDRHPSDFDFPTAFRLLVSERPDVLARLIAEHAPALLAAVKETHAP